MKTQKTERAAEFAKYGSNLLEAPKVIPLKLKKGIAAPLLIHPRFFDLSIAYCIEKAREVSKGRIPVNDKATAIAILLGEAAL
jgi:hypothetical protein